MAKTLSQSSGCKVSGKKPATRASGRKALEKKLIAELRAEMPKKLSKYAEWCLKNPNGMEGTYDLRAVMK